MHKPEIIKERAEEFLRKHTFDLYIGNPFSAKFFPENSPSLILTRSAYSDLPKLKHLIKNNGSNILAFGAGSVFDPAKYIASISDSCLTIIPSALSVNAFSTHRSSFFSEDSKKSLDTTAPDLIVLDFELLKTAGTLNLLGIVELASTSIALTDWELALEKGLEKENSDIKHRSHALIRKSITLLKNTNNISENLEDLFEGLLESGMLTQEYGNGRPVSGSEHIISSYIENCIECAHGAGLYIGILIAYELQKLHGRGTKESEIIVDYLLGNEVIRQYVINQFNQDTIIEILSRTEARSQKYTILDECQPEILQLTIRKICDNLFG